MKQQRSWIGKKLKIMKTREDRNGNAILDGSWNINYSVIDFSDYSQISHRVSNSETTESVYVTYTNEENGLSATVRFSLHENNAVKFGDQLDGNFVSEHEVLARLGLMKRVFIPNTYLSIDNRKVKFSDIALYEEAELTIKEMYAMGAGADLSQFTGKLAKGSNYLILGTKVTEVIDFKVNSFGLKVQIGRYIYE